MKKALRIARTVIAIGAALSLTAVVAADLAVERIYRSEPFTSDEERLEHLFKLYAKMAK